MFFFFTKLHSYYIAKKAVRNKTLALPGGVEYRVTYRVLRTNKCINNNNNNTPLRTPNILLYFIFNSLLLFILFYFFSFIYSLFFILFYLFFSFF